MLDLLRLFRKNAIEGSIALLITIGLSYLLYGSNFFLHITFRMFVGATVIQVIMFMQVVLVKDYICRQLKKHNTPVEHK